jgi:hypothetical protein
MVIQTCPSYEQGHLKEKKQEEDFCSSGFAVVTVRTARPNPYFDATRGYIVIYC